MYKAAIGAIIAIITLRYDSNINNNNISNNNINNNNDKSVCHMNHIIQYYAY